MLPSVAATGMSFAGSRECRTTLAWAAINAALRPGVLCPGGSNLMARAASACYGRRRLQMNDSFQILPCFSTSFCKGDCYEVQFAYFAGEHS
jgi:hypothetical protein